MLNPRQVRARHKIAAFCGSAARKLIERDVDLVKVVHERLAGMIVVDQEAVEAGLFERRGFGFAGS